MLSKKANNHTKKVFLEFAFYFFTVLGLFVWKHFQFHNFRTYALYFTKKLQLHFFASKIQSKR